LPLSLEELVFNLGADLSAVEESLGLEVCVLEEAEANEAAPKLKD